MRLFAAANTLVPAILLLEERGFSVEKRLAGSDELWVARKESLELVAEDPLQLLGLTALAEARGEAWRATDEQIDDVIARFHLA